MTYYNVLRSLYTKSNKSRRDFVHGCKYKRMFNYTHLDVVNWMAIGNFDIKVKLRDDTYTTIKVRRAPEVLSENLLVMHHLLKDAVENSRVKCGDSGKMFGLGFYNDTEEFYLSRDNTEIKEMMLTISQLQKEWVMKEFPEEYEKYFKEGLSKKEFDNCLSDFMVQSRSLCNSSHYDTNDGTITICT